jgi:hypothetical protein
MRSSGSTPTTSHPRSRNSCEAIPVPHPTSRTRRTFAPSIAASTAAAGYDGRARSYCSASAPNERRRSSSTRAPCLGRPHRPATTRKFAALRSRTSRKRLGDTHVTHVHEPVDLIAAEHAAFCMPQVASSEEMASSASCRRTEGRAKRRSLRSRVSAKTARRTSEGSKDVPQVPPAPASQPSPPSPDRRAS